MGGGGGWVAVMTDNERGWGSEKGYSRGKERFNVPLRGKGVFPTTQDHHEPLGEEEEDECKRPRQNQLHAPLCTEPARVS